jgi:hypothetical protein
MAEQSYIQGAISEEESVRKYSLFKLIPRSCRQCPVGFGTIDTIYNQSEELNLDEVSLREPIAEEFTVCINGIAYIHDPLLRNNVHCAHPELEESIHITTKKMAANILSKAENMQEAGKGQI